MTEIGEEIDGEFKYTSITVGVNGKLYAPPFAANKVLEIDPCGSKVREFGDCIDGAVKYSCIAAAANGKLYSPPFGAGKVLEIDPEGGSVREVGDTISGDSKYESIVASADGKLYAPPYSAGRVLEIDPWTTTVREIGEPMTGVMKYASITAGANGKLYAPPFFVHRVLEIDPEAGTVQEIGEDMSGPSKYKCIVAGTNGKLYAPPSHAARVLEVSPELGAVREIGEVIPGGDKYGSIAAGSNGMLYAAPISCHHVLEIMMQGLPCCADHLEAIAFDPEFSDTAVIVGGETFLGHRVMLARLPFFSAAFRQDFAERATSKIEIRDVEPKAFRVVWRAIYSDNLHFVNVLQGAEFLGGVLQAAHRFEMVQLQAAVAARLAEVLMVDLTPTTVASWLSTARRLNVPLVQHVCVAFIQRHASEVLISEGPRDWSQDMGTWEVLVEAATGKRRRLNGR